MLQVEKISWTTPKIACTPSRVRVLLAVAARSALTRICVLHCFRNWLWDVSTRSGVLCCSAMPQSTSRAVLLYRKRENPVRSTASVKPAPAVNARVGGRTAPEGAAELPSSPACTAPEGAAERPSSSACTPEDARGRKFVSFRPTKDARGRKSDALRPQGPQVACGAAAVVGTVAVLQTSDVASMQMSTEQVQHDWIMAFVDMLT